MLNMVITESTEYVPFDYIVKRYNVSRKTLDRWLKEFPEIHELNMTRPDAAFGRRLVHWESFRKFMESRRVPKKGVLQAA